MRLDFKFRESAVRKERDEVVDRVKELGATKVEPLFAGEDDAELASLYKAEGVPDGQADEIVSELDAIDAVEFAEKSPPRKTAG